MIRHKFASAIADDPTASAAGEVLPSHWNDDHEQSFTAHSLSGLSVTIPQASYFANWPAIMVRVYRSNGREVMTNVFATPDSVTIDSNVPLDGHTAIIY